MHQIVLWVKAKFFELAVGLTVAITFTFVVGKFIHEILNEYAMPPFTGKHSVRIETSDVLDGIKACREQHKVFKHIILDTRHPGEVLIECHEKPNGTKKPIGTHLSTWARPTVAP